MYAPAVHDESQTLVNYVDQQLEALRAAPYGLTEEEAFSTPCRSTLSLAGLVKHATHGMRGVVAFLGAGETPSLDEAGYAAYLGSFTRAAGESAVGLLAAFDEARPGYLEAVGAADPDEERLAAPAPWYGIHEPQPMRTRYYLAHQVEEMARHAGHADIIREQIDGMAVPALVMSRAGLAGNAFFDPYRPRPGTLDS